MKTSKNKKSAPKASHKAPQRSSSPRDVNPEERDGQSSKQPSSHPQEMSNKGSMQSRR